MSDFLTQAAYFIQCVGGIVASIIQGNPLSNLLVTVFTVFCTLKVLGKLRYRENGG